MQPASKASSINRLPCLYFATFWHPSHPHIYVLFLLLITTIITFTITSHMGSWSHQLCAFTAKTLPSFELYPSIFSSYKTSFKSHTCWSSVRARSDDGPAVVNYEVMYLYFDWPAQEEDIGYWYMNRVFIHFTTGKCKIYRTQVICSLSTDHRTYVYSQMYDIG
jgi:hypothetical protein